MKEEIKIGKVEWNSKRSETMEHYEKKLHAVLEEMREKYNLNSINDVIWQMTLQMKKHRLKLFDSEEESQVVDLSSIFEND